MNTRSTSTMTTTYQRGVYVSGGEFGGQRRIEALQADDLRHCRRGNDGRRGKLRGKRAEALIMCWPVQSVGASASHDGGFLAFRWRCNEGDSSNPPKGKHKREEKRKREERRREKDDASVCVCA
ncbi:hypothetical protein GW17_00009506 [Ensete ventricosum]|nr:hypothetical protein GW17_00009506 [Ensete ventricosum]RZR97405.1 hypothetical protein BHM03_00026589 [Ensete ventricosum]